MQLAPVLRQRYLDANGNPLAAGKLYTYITATTTPQATYTDQAGGTANANPVVLDANGEAAVWLDPDLSYKFVLKTSADVVQWTTDGVVGTLTPDSVLTISIADLAVTTAKINDLAVTPAKIAADAVTTAKILDSNVTIAKIADLAVTWAKRALRAASASVSAGGIAVSTSSGEFSTTSASFVDVTNLSVTIITSGNPVRIELTQDGTDSADTFLNDAIVKFLRGATSLCELTCASERPSAVSMIDFPVAGTYTYKLQAKKGTTSADVFYCKLVAYEL